MSFRTIFTRTPSEKSPAYGESWATTMPEPHADFLAECENLPKRILYCVINGYNQYMLDGTSAAKTEAEWLGKLAKNYDNVNLGRVKASTQVTIVKKSPIEVEILRLATVQVDEWIEEKKWKKTAAERAALIELYGSTAYTELSAKAKVNLEKKTEIKANPDLQAELAALMAPMAKKSAK